MNKPTREQIEHRAIELMLEEGGSCAFCDQNSPLGNCFGGKCKSSLMKTALRKAEEELTPKYFASDESRLYFQKQLADLIGATDHRYKYFEKSRKPVLHMKFYIDENEYDTISGIWGTAYSLNFDKKYLK